MLSKAETTATMWYVKRKAGKRHNCICIGIHFLFLIFFCWRVKVWQTVLVLLQQLWQNWRVPPSEKLCGNYKPFTWHGHYTARITIFPFEIADSQMRSPYRSSSQPRIIQHLNQTYISIETWQNSFLRLAQRRCVSLYLHGSGREEKVGERECTSLLFTPLSNW